MPVIYQKKGSELTIGDTVQLFDHNFTIDAIEWHPGMLVGCKLVPGRAVRSGNFYAFIRNEASVNVVKPLMIPFFRRV